MRKIISLNKGWKFTGPAGKAETVEGKDGKVRAETFHKVDGAQVKVELLDAEGKPAAQGEGTDVTLSIPMRTGKNRI